MKEYEYKVQFQILPVREWVDCSVKFKREEDAKIAKRQFKQVYPRYEVRILRRSLEWEVVE